MTARRINVVRASSVCCTPIRHSLFDRRPSVRSSGERSQPGRPLKLDPLWCVYLGQVERVGVGWARHEQG